LFMEKWHRFGKTVFSLLLMFEVIHIGALVALMLNMKHSRKKVTAAWPVFVLLSIIPIILEDIRLCRLFYLSITREGSRWDRTREVFLWVHSFEIDTRALGLLFASMSSVYVLAVSRTLESIDPGLPPVAIYDGIWVLLALAMYFAIDSFVASVFSQHQGLGVLYKTSRRMMGDVLKFVVLFLAYFARNGIVMYTTMPLKEGHEKIHQVPEFNNILSTLQGMLTLALVGDPLGVEFVDDAYNLDVPNETFGQSVDFFFFMIFYVLFVVACLVLLLNLLIAMMTSTFDSMTKNATLDWRVDFARLVLKLELEAKVMYKREARKAGKKESGQDDTYYYEFLSVEPNKEGYGTEGSMRVFDTEDRAQGGVPRQGDAPRRRSRTDRAHSNWKLATSDDAQKGLAQIEGVSLTRMQPSLEKNMPLSNVAVAQAGSLDVEAAAASAVQLPQVTLRDNYRYYL